MLNGLLLTSVGQVGPAERTTFGNYHTRHV